MHIIQKCNMYFTFLYQTVLYVLTTSVCLRILLHTTSSVFVVHVTSLTPAYANDLKERIRHHESDLLILMERLPPARLMMSCAALCIKWVAS